MNIDYGTTYEERAQNAENRVASLETQLAEAKRLIKETVETYDSDDNGRTLRWMVDDLRTFLRPADSAPAAPCGLCVAAFSDGRTKCPQCGRSWAATVSVPAVLAPCPDHREIDPGCLECQDLMLARQANRTIAESGISEEGVRWLSRPANLDKFLKMVASETTGGTPTGKKTKGPK